MKKFVKGFIAILLAVVLTLSLAACGKREFAADGKYTAFATGTHSNYAGVVTPELTVVTVTIKNDKITGYYIDVRQAVRTQSEDEDGNVTYAFAFNAKTKKELLYDYGMKEASPIEKEWFEQAEAIEAFMLEHGPAAIKLKEDGTYDGIAGATMDDGGVKELALAAIELAKAGKFQAVYASGTDVYSAHMMVNAKGEPTELVIDTLQMGRSASSTGTFVWNTETKQQLGYRYGMHAPEAGLMPVTTANEAQYKTWLKDNNKLEWFEQVELIAKDVLAKGLQGYKYDAIATVTITTTGYEAVIKGLAEASK